MTSAAGIRVAGEGDVEPAAVLACRAAPERGMEGWTQALREDRGHPQRLLLVAGRGGGVVGYGRARLFEHPPDAPADTAPEGYYLTGLFVDRDFRRTGVGAALTDARLRWIAQRADDAWFFANARNVASMQLHRRFGFEEVTREFSFPGVTFDGGEGVLFRSRLRELFA